MPLTSASTHADIVAAYRDNASYDLNGSVTECKNFIQALRFLIQEMAEEVRRGDESVRDTYQKFSEELAKAEKWRAVHDSTAKTSSRGRRIRHADFSSYRG